MRPSTILDIYNAIRKDGKSWTLDEVQEKVQMPGPSDDFRDFLARFPFIFGEWITPQHLNRITREAIEDNYREGVRYLELRYCPQTLAKRTGIPFENSFEYIYDAVRNANEDLQDMYVGLLISINQSDGAEAAGSLVETATALYHNKILGFDIAGNPSTVPLETYESLCRKIRDAGWPLSIHAGEIVGAESVRTAIDLLGARRIGHGIHAISDESVIDLILQKNVLLEISLTSNYYTNAVPDLTRHPLPTLRKKGVKCSINTDDPTIFNTDLQTEYSLAAVNYHFCEQDFVKMNQDALKAGFASEAEKIKYKFQL